jgi:hypothetical protein
MLRLVTPCSSPPRAGKEALRRWLLGALVAFALPGCSFEFPTTEPPPVASARTIEGTVVDFETAQVIAGAASVSTSGLVPAPSIASQGAAFTIRGVPNNSTFQILASAPVYRGTFSEAVIVETDDLRGVIAPVVSEAFLMELAVGFGITPTAARGVLLARVVDGSGQPKAGVAKSNFLLDASVSGPFFLDANRQPAPAAAATTASGWAIWFEVSPGLATLDTSPTTTATLDMAVSPISPATVTLAMIRATDGVLVLPSNVSFRNHVVPIFSARGCISCHSAGGPGRDLGGLSLDSSASIIYRELTEEDPLRVQPLMAEQSQLLTFPSREDPPDRHPNVTFTSPRDPDYLKLLVWIREGAKNN